MIKEAIGVGETISAAQKKAYEALGSVPEQGVKFEVIQLPSKKFLGVFGGKEAKVKAIYSVNPAKVAEDYLHDILVEYGLKDFIIEKDERPESVAFHVTGKNVKIVIGKRGDTLDAIQYLVGLVANDVCDFYYRVTINVSDYRERREKTLIELGQKLAKKVQRTGEAIILEPMTAYERKVIHVEVGKVDGVTSWSEGEDLDRHVVIALESDKEKVENKEDQNLDT